MGAYLSKPITEKETEEGAGNRLSYGASCMQGWRISQEDAHNCITEFNKDSSLFAVYDGHGGAEVAVYLARHFPQFFKNTEDYQKGNWEGALHEAYVKIDAQIKTPIAMSEIQKIAKKDAGDNEGNIADYDEENVGELYREATMPIDALMAKYSIARGAAGLSIPKAFVKEGEGGDRPGSSKDLGQSSSSSSVAAAPASSSPSKAAAVPAGNEADEPQSSAAASSAPPDLSVKKTTEPDCTSSSSSSSSSNKQVQDTSAQKSMATDSPPEPPVTQNENSSSMDVEPSSSTSEADCDSASTTTKSASGVNGIVENTEPDSTAEEPATTKKVEQSSTVNGSADQVKVNGNSEADSTQAVQIGESKISEVDTRPKRKGKVHPPAPLAMPKQTRSSPRKKLDEAKVYKDFIAEDNGSSDSDDAEDEVVKKLAENSDSDDDDDDNVVEGNSSSSDEDVEVGEDEDDDDDDDDDDEDDDDDGVGGNKMLSEMQEPGYDSGCTAVVAFCKWDGDKLHLYVANAGDSRCVVSRNGTALEMSHDHKPEDELEARRIVNAGGKVTADGRVNSGLNLSRAIGDHSYKQNFKLPPEEQMITPVPDIRHQVLDPTTDQFIVLACDGVWNSMTSQEVVDFITQRFKKGLKEAQICEELFDACLAPDTSGDGTGCDNMTAIIVKLPQASSSLGEDNQKFTSASVAGATNDQNKRRLSESEEVSDESKRLKTSTTE